MPHINRIRVNNVKYNFGTQYYDDFMMKPFCHNMLYDLANGGGKSVLMLLLLQNVIPNCTLDEKQPIEKLFRTAEGSSTIHSLIEWRLSEKDVKNDYKYMTTGFCARRALNATTDAEEAGVESKDTAAIEYFNYCIFYRDYNDNDIRNLPLVNNNERITYTGLRKLLKELERDNSLIVKVFDRKGEYQHFISQYGIYESEWEIIRGINKTEGHVRTYFESNYKTTRKVVEDLLIEEIIQKSFRNRMNDASNEGLMADTLLSIKDKLVELSKKKAQISDYDRQVEVLEGFASRISSLTHLFEEKQELEQMLSKGYYSCIQVLAKKNQEYEDACNRRDGLDAEILRLKKGIDAAKLYKEKHYYKELSQGREAFLKQLEEIKSRVESKQKEVNLKESMNDYLDYIEEKKNRDEIALAIENIKNKNENLIYELNELAYNQKMRNETSLNLLEDKLSSYEEDLRTYESQYQELDHLEREISKEIAVKEVAKESARKEIHFLEEQIAAIRKNVNLLFVEEIDHVILQRKDDILEVEKELKQLDNKVTEFVESRSLLRSKLAEIEFEESSLISQMEQGKEFLKQYEELNKKIGLLKDVYNEEDTKGLVTCLEENYRERVIKESLLTKQLHDCKEYLEELKGQQSLPITEDLRRAKDYLDSIYPESCVLGVDYLRGLNNERIDNLITSIPLLPYSLVMKNNFDELSLNQDFASMYFGEHPIPIIDMRFIESDGGLHLSEGYLFSTRGKEVFSATFIEKENARILRQCEELEEAILKLKDLESTYKEDLAIVRKFMDQFEGSYHKQTEQFKKADHRKKQLEAKTQELLSEQTNKENSYDELLHKKDSAVKRLEDLKQEELSLVRIKELYQKQVLLQIEEKDIQNELEERLRRYEVIVAEYQDILKKREETNEYCKQLKQQLQESKLEWEQTYSKYYKEGSYSILSLSDEELSAQFRGKKLAFEREHTDLEDKERLIDSYVNGMNKSLRAISKRGYSIAYMEELKRSHQLLSTSEDTLNEIHHTLESWSTEYKKQNELYEQKKAQMHQLEGRIEQMELLLKGEYGDIENEAFLDLAYDTFLSENETALDVLRKDYQTVTLKTKELEKVVRRLEDRKKDMERIIRMLPKTEVNREESMQKASDLLENFEDTYEKYERVLREVRKRVDECEKLKTKTEQTLILLNAYELAKEFERSVTIPEDYEDARALIQSIYEINEYIGIEKRRILQGAEDLEKIKDNFENQCLQCCSNIRTELERLSKLSKITLDGESIPMIHLSIPYVKQEFEKQQMSRYIDEIVKAVDTLSTNTERLKYIQNALSWKKLFSVVVTNMNSIKLNLYKRERIKEQSRHLRYEEAVGSTGQSQGIYIQFLIAIINYITCLNSMGADNDDLRKVIFIDNPFGAAKDVYIWEPIFALLKANHVQLIVPARGTTPAITGRFDVNYILGQKLMEGKQQTVVVDYHSQVDTDRAEYEPLQFEQATFDF